MRAHAGDGLEVVSLIGWGDRWPTRGAALSGRRRLLASFERGIELFRPGVYSGTRVNCDGHVVPLADGAGHVRFPVGAHAVDKGEGVVGTEGGVEVAGDDLTR